MSVYTEICEQPEVLAALLREQWPAVQEAAKAIRSRDIAYVFLSARGTSAHAGFYAQYLWGMYNRLVVASASPSMFTRYQAAPDLSRALVLGISQSGESPDIVEVVAEGARQGALTMAITNAPGSPLAQAADFTLDVRAGAEKAVAATKSYTAQLLTIAMLSVALDDPSGERRAQLGRVPEAAAAVLAHEAVLQEIAAKFRHMERCLILGRGYNFATTLEWGLKMKEMAYVAADPYSSAEFQHGPAALVTPGLPVFATAPQDAVYEDVLGLLERLVAQQAQLVVLSDDERALSLTQDSIRLPALPSWLSPLTAIIPAQIFCYHLTVAKGNDPNMPRGLNKVTRTT
ncbi:SIS domain-containing protein [Chloroflexia bacterium SDU3-3]|nr:SIS domain-containing protein [Chloroflexia bacterium SDU3-3]